MTQGTDGTPNHEDAPNPEEAPVNAPVNESDLALEEQVVALRQDLEGAWKEIDQSRELAQRAHADMANFRRRTDEERIEAQKHSNSRLIIKILPVVDELELAINLAGDGGPNASWLEGVRLIQRKVTSLLESEGVAKIDALGVAFDPLEHEALGTDESTEYPPGHITDVVRNGYRMHGRVIQPAQVIVAREKQAAN